LLNEGKRLAERQGTTIRRLVEEGLRRVLREHRADQDFRLRKASFRSRGLLTQLDDGQWDRIRELAYEDRGA
jgi:hypothetical protein